MLSTLFVDKLRVLYIKNIMKKGKLGIALTFFREMLVLLKHKINVKDVPFNIFQDAIGSYLPSIDLRKVTLGGQSNTVPIGITSKRQLLVSCIWFFKELKGHKASAKTDAYVNLLLEAKKDSGAMQQKKKAWESEGLKNRVFVHYL